MRFSRLLLGPLLAALLAGPARAQTDTILRTDGEEVRGRVLALSPSQVVYVPAPVPAGPMAAARPDTLRLPIGSVFLIRYANGTKEVLQRLNASTDQPVAGALLALSPAQRAQRGGLDALDNYRGQRAFAGALGATLLVGPLVGLATTAAIGKAPVKPQHLEAPTPGLLFDPDYGAGYRQQANHTKRKRAWAGYGTGVVIQVLLLGLLATSTAP